MRDRFTSPAGDERTELLDALLSQEDLDFDHLDGSWLEEMRSSAVPAAVSQAVAEWAPPQSAPAPSFVGERWIAAAAAALVVVSGATWLSRDQGLVEPEAAVALHSWDFEDGQLALVAGSAIEEPAGRTPAKEAVLDSDSGLIGRMDFEDGLLR